MTTIPKPTYFAEVYNSNGGSLINMIHERDMLKRLGWLSHREWRTQQRRDAIAAFGNSKQRRKMLGGRMQTKELHMIRELLIERDGQSCRGCAIVLDIGGDEGLQVDHIIPLARGGKSELINFQLLCRECNNEKADRLDWVPKLGVAV